MGVSRSAAPDHNILAAFASLYEELVVVCPNLKLPPVKTSSGLQALHASCPCFFSNRPVSRVADEIGGMIRCCAGKYREVLQNPDCRRVLFSKATQGNQGCPLFNRSHKSLLLMTVCVCVLWPRRPLAVSLALGALVSWLVALLQLALP
eukprot:2144381-Alexandrium_andersonii.AAC.1